MLHNVSVPRMRVRRRPSRADKRRNLSYMLYQAELCLVGTRRERAEHLRCALQGERVSVQKPLSL